MLGLESVQFSIHKRREVKLPHFLSRTLFGTLYVRGRKRTVFFKSGQGKKVKLQHFPPRTLFGTLYVRDRERTVFFTSG